jgi:predicted PhzF superfamily epimerase YddE/YHI9
VRYPLHLVDAFANGRYTGNPAAISLLTSPAEPTWMQQVAMEMNQAETAFLTPDADGYGLRWFTPTVEVDLCGHATLAAAHFLYSTGRATGSVRFMTKSGVMTAEQMGEEIELDFPAEPPLAAQLPAPQTWLETTPLWTGANRLDWFVRLGSAEALRGLRPNFSEIAALGRRGLIVTAEGDEGYDFMSRCFFPQSGIDEDPVTGSAHCALSPYWSGELGRPSLVGYQASRRGGIVGVEFRGDRVRLRGRAITTLEGWLLHDDPVA